MTEEELREDIFNIITDPPCRQYKNGKASYCEFYDYQGTYCFLKVMHKGTKKCKLLDQIFSLPHLSKMLEILKLAEWDWNRVAVLDKDQSLPELPIPTNLDIRSGFLLGEENMLNDHFQKTIDRKVVKEDETNKATKQ